MCPNGTANMGGRINVRTTEWVEHYMDITARRGEDWSNSSEVARDMIEKGIVLSELATIGGEFTVDSPVLNWRRLRGIYPGDDMLVCPSCTHSNKFLFRLRNHYGKDGIQCLACGLLDAEEGFKEDMPDGHYWARSATSRPDVGFHIMSDETGHSLCGDYEDDGGKTFINPDPDERPEWICGVCWDMNRQGMVDEPTSD